MPCTCDGAPRSERTPTTLSPTARVIPPVDHAILAFPAEQRQCARVEDEAPTFLCGEVEPSGGEDPQKVPVANDGNRATEDRIPVDRCIGTSSDFVDRLAVENVVGPDRPVGNGLARLVGRDSFVIAVVPLKKRVVGGRGQPDETRSLPGAPEGAREGMREGRLGNSGASELMWRSTAIAAFEVAVA